MDHDTRQYDVVKVDKGEHLVTIAPSSDAAQTQAAAIIYALRKDKALLNAIIAAAVSPSSAIYTNTLLRFRGVVRDATTVELSVGEADVLADDIHDAMVAGPPCEAVNCTIPEFHQGLCWAHYRERELVIAERTAAATAKAVSA